MGDKGHATLICCNNCAHDFGREFRKILKELRKTSREIVSMDELPPKSRDKYFPSKYRKGYRSILSKCEVCKSDVVSRHRIEWRRSM